MRFSCLVEIWKGRGGGSGLYAANACELFSPDINYDYLTYIISCLFNCSNYLGYDGKATETYCLHIWRKNRHILAKQEANCKVFIRDPCNQGILHDVVCLILVYHITKTRPPDIPCSGDPQFPNSEQESPSQPTLTHRKTPERPEIYTIGWAVSHWAPQDISKVCRIPQKLLSH